MEKTKKFSLSLRDKLHGWRKETWYQLTVLNYTYQLVFIGYYEDENVAQVLGEKCGGHIALKTVEVKTKDDGLGYIIENGKVKETAINMEDSYKARKEALELIKRKLNPSEIKVIETHFLNFPLSPLSFSDNP